MLTGEFIERVPWKVVQAWEQMQLNTYGVLHLQKALWDSDLQLCERGTREIYDRVAYQLVRDVSKAIFGKQSYRRRPKHRKRLPNAVTLERFDDCPHLNVLIHRPATTSLEEFETIFRQEWEKFRWAGTGPNAFYLKPMTGGAVAYSFKEGPDALLERSLSFHR